MHQVQKCFKAPQLPPINGSTKINDNDLNKVVVITKNDLERITGHLNRRQKEKDVVMDELNRKKELHEKSLALTKSWNNTIEVRLEKNKHNFLILIILIF